MPIGCSLNESMADGRGFKRPYVTGIDGLRAVAVLSVLSYHIDNRILPGGFVGVDIFFVISGFVVSMATTSRPSQNLSQLLLNFYSRRVLRILPAVLVFLLVTQFFAVLFVPVKDRLVTTDITAGAASVGLSNVALWLEAGDYFSFGVAWNPFAHTWSLAVEEQFYILFPLFAFQIWMKRGDLASFERGWVAVAVCAVASLTIAAAMTRIDHAFAFYMLPSRFWELAVGMLLFVYLRSKTPVLDDRLNTAFSFFGCALLAASLLFTNPDHFPFPDALAPVLAAAALIFVVYTAPDSILSRVLSFRVARYFGRISYSLYLWHWGVIVLMRWTVGLETQILKLTAVLISVALADLSYRLIERPIRRNSFIAAARDWKVVTTGITAIGFVGASIVVLTFFRSHLTLSVTGDLNVWLPSEPGRGGICGVAQGRNSLQGGVGKRFTFEPRDCREKVEPHHLYVIGDSHAGAYQRLVGNVVRAKGWEATIYMATGCAVAAPPTDTTSATADADTTRCGRFIDESLRDSFDTAKHYDVIFLPGLRVQRYRELGETELKEYVPPQIYTETMAANEVARLKPLLDHGVRVILEAPKPVYRYAPIQCSDWFNKNNPQCKTAPVTAAEMQLRRKYVLDMFARLKQLDPRIEVWDPFPLLCPGEVCLAMQGLKPLVSDGDHLSGYANDYLSPFLIAVLEKQ